MNKDSPDGVIRHVMVLVPGLIVAAAFAALSMYLSPLTAKASSALFGVPVTIMPPVVGIVIGVMFHNMFGAKANYHPGIVFSIKKILRWSVALFGLKIAIGDIIGLGMDVVAWMILTMFVTVAASILAARMLGSTRHFGALAGAGTAVCGASAALAASTVLPDYEGKDEDTAFAAVSVNLIATVAMLLYPPVAHALGYSPRQTGIFLGASIHDVAQVVGAGFAVSDRVGTTAVVMKLFRVLMLLPVILGIGFYFCKTGKDDCNKAKVPFPVFALMFVVFAIINSVHILPPVLEKWLINISNFGLLMAIASLGLNTNMKAFLKVGPRDLGVVMIATVVIFAMTLGWAGYIHR